MKEKAPQKNAIVFFDGVCNLCARSVQFIIRHDATAYFHFASLQSEMGKQARAAVRHEKGKFPDSVVLLQDGVYYTGSDAALRIAGHLNGAWRLLSALRVIPRLIREPFYRVIANNRYRWFGKQESCWLPTPELKSRFVG